MIKILSVYMNHFRTFSPHWSAAQWIQMRADNVLLLALFGERTAAKLTIVQSELQSVGEIV